MKKIEMKIGSPEHKELFCRSFMESYQEYEPEKLPWPKLEGVYLERLRGIPFWQEALRIEREAGAMVSAYGERITDPLVKDAIALQGKEEARHARLIEYLIDYYQIEVTEPVQEALPDNLEEAFIDFGFGECLDSFCAFGLFDIARQAKYLPEPIFQIFDPILHEEARHIVFFVNWITYLQINQGKGLGVLRGSHALWHYARAIQDILETFKASPDGTGKGFTASGATTFMDDLTLEMFLTTTLKENEKRMRVFDPQLLQPRLLPRVAKVMLKGMKLIPKKKVNSKEITA
jgi:hypothetical protein